MGLTMALQLAKSVFVLANRQKCGRVNGLTSLLPSSSEGSLNIKTEARRDTETWRNGKGQTWKDGDDDRDERENSVRVEVNVLTC